MPAALRTRRVPTPVLALAVILGAIATLSGCGGGSSSNSAAPTAVVGPVDITAMSPDEGGAGTILTITGHGFNLDPAKNQVVFVQTGAGSADIVGQILSVASMGFDANGDPVTVMTVRVPSNVRSSLVTVSTTIGPDFVLVGTEPFVATPVIASIVHGATNAGFMRVNVANATFTDFDVIAYGYNLDGVVGVTVTDENLQPVAVTLLPTVPGAAPAPADGMSAVAIRFAGGTQVAMPNCFESAALMLRVEIMGNGGMPISSNAAPIKVRKVLPTGEQEDLHGSVMSLLTPSGVRAGDIECHFNVHAEADAATVRFNVIPQYRNANSAFVDCTIVGGPITVLPGRSVEPSAYPSIPAVGNVSSFIWDSATDLPGFDGFTELRILLDQVGATFLCDQNPDGEFFSGRIAIDNRGIAGVTGAGAIVETFDDTRHRGVIGSTPGAWVAGAGQVEGVEAPATTPSQFGAGTASVTLGNNIAYTIDTDAGTITIDDSTLGLPDPLTVPDNPGALINELHVRTLTIEPDAIVTVTGTAPVVFRVAGTGNPDDVTVRVDGTIGLSGADGEPGVEGTPGAGGIGVAGGGDGGTGGVALASVTGIQSLTQATPGAGPGGGGAGASTSWISQVVPTGRGGPGGGAGHLTPGEDGVNNDPSNAIAKADPGVGGSAYGDSRLVHLVGGSGGGGGGTAIRFVPTVQLFTDKSGGGGGAGGGAIEIAADGIIEINGAIRCDGGAGGSGATGPHGGAGGPGSGGSIAIRGTGGVRISETALLTAQGRPGTEHNNNSPTFRSGDSSDGRIHIESNGPVTSPSLNSLTGLEPALSDPGVSGAINLSPIDVGNGGDGALNLGTEPAGTTWVIDTGATAADFAQVFDELGAVVITAAQPGGILELSSLTVPADITLRVWGGNPLVMRVQGSAFIDGTIDASGGPGGLVDASGLDPVAGLGGRSGPGGGHGGDGGYNDGMVSIAAAVGGLPGSLPADMVAQPPYSSNQPTSNPGEVVRARPAMGGLNAGGAFNDRPSGGGGGAFTHDGGAGSQKPASTTLAGGAGGSRYLSNLFAHPFTLMPVRAGGGGGAGGGASSGIDPPLAHAPGTGGGGGGGFVEIAAGDLLTVNSTAQLLARGGNAYRAPQFAANGGSGAGGAIRLRGLGLVRIDGAVIDVAGGAANLPPADHPDPAQVAAATYTANFGFVGGTGSSGRIRIESPLGFSTEVPAACAVNVIAGVCPPATVGTFVLADAGVSVAMSLTYHAGVEGGAYPGMPQFGALQQTPGFSPDEAPTVWSFVRGASEDINHPGAPAEFGAWTDDPSTLRSVQYLQMKHVLVSAPTAGGGATHPVLDSAEVLLTY